MLVERRQVGEVGDEEVGWRCWLQGGRLERLVKGKQKSLSTRFRFQYKPMFDLLY